MASSSSQLRAPEGGGLPPERSEPQREARGERNDRDRERGHRGGRHRRGRDRDKRGGGDKGGGDGQKSAPPSDKAPPNP